MLYSPHAHLGAVDQSLISRFGPIDLRSPDFEFTFTDYYSGEMGPDLQKRFCSFERLVMPEDLPDLKKASMEIESGFAISGTRTVNIDPGYLEESKLVLASTKNFSHRIYLRNDIWAEVTLRFVRGEFVKHEWTYPDYSQKLAIQFLKSVREIYRKQLQDLNLQ